MYQHLCTTTFLTSAKQILDAVKNRKTHKVNYDKAMNDEIAKHQQSLLRSNKRAPRKTNHFINAQPNKKRRKSVSKVKAEPQDKDPEMEAEITKILAEFVDFVFMIWHHYLFKILHFSLLLFVCNNSDCRSCRKRTKRSWSTLLSIYAIG